MSANSRSRRAYAAPAGEISFAPATDSGTMYAAPYGSDANSGLSPDRPVLSIQTALDRLSANSRGGIVQLLFDDTLIGNIPTWAIDYAPITIPEACGVRGQGRGKRLRLSDGSDASLFTLATVSDEFCSISDLWIDGNKTNQSGTSHGIHFSASGGSGFQFNDSLHVISNVLVSTFLSHGIFMDTSTRDFFISGCQARNCSGNGFRLVGTDGFMAGCTSGGSGLEGIVLAGANNRVTGSKSFNAGQITAANGDGFLISTVRSLIAFCESQDNTQHGFNFSGSGRSEGVGLYSDSNGLTTTGYGYRVNNCSSLHLQGIANDRQGTPTQSHAIRFDGTNTFNFFDIVGRGNVNAGISGTLADSNHFRFSDNAASIHHKLQHVAAATPTGGYSGEVRIGTDVIWVNDAGTWKSVAIS